MEAKEVIALQAFVPDDVSEHIRSLCTEACGLSTNSRMGFPATAKAHVTISAWSMTPSETAVAVERLKSAEIKGLKGITVSCELSKRYGRATSAWYLIPTEKARPGVDAFRTKAMDAMAIECEDFDRRSKPEWWPHLTLFGVRTAEEEKVQEVLKKLEAIGTLDLIALALVGFDNGAHTLDHVELEGAQ